MYCFPYPRTTKALPLKVPELSRVRPGSFAAQLQSALFFGLASAVLLRHVAPEEFFDEKENSFIDIRIPQWFWLELNTKWNSLEAGASKRVIKIFRGKFDELLNGVRRTLLLQELVDTSTDDEDLSLVLLSVQMLLFVVSRRFDQKMLQSTVCTQSRKYLAKRMIGHGWCRRRLNIFNTSATFIPVLYYLSSISAPDSGVHTTCTFQRCSVFNRLEEPAHRSPGCCCQDVSVVLSDVCRCLANDQIPLIRVRAHTLNQLTLEVIPYSNDTAFTAISHVWSDRQFGSTKNALPQCQFDYLCNELAKLPRQINDWRFQDYFPTSTTMKTDIEPPSNTYQLFWLDTFCIPQDEEYAALRDKALNMMNLVYGAASQTLVFDKTLQSLDTGQQPSSLSVGGKPSFYGPKDDIVLEMLGEISASRWMGRAWTLQEAVLSRSIVFSTKTSLLYLALQMHPSERWSQELKHDVQTGISWLKKTLKLGSGFSNTLALSQRSSMIEEPLEDMVHKLMFSWIKDILQVEKHWEYTRSVSGRAVKFVDAHKLLQARTTSMTEDLPLILMNLSGLNGNSTSTIRDTDERMRLLMYALEILPLELLLSPCERLRVAPATLDSWIPREVLPLRFEGKHSLKLTEHGFTFQSTKEEDDDNGDLEFFLLPRSCYRVRHCLLSHPREGNEADSLYWTEAQEHVRRLSSEHRNLGSDLYVVLLVHGIDPKAARFKVSRVEGSTTYLHFDCPLRVSYVKGLNKSGSKHLLWPIHHLKPPLARQNFVLERSPTSTDLGTARPQNTVQHEGRYNIAHEWTWQLLYYVELWLSRGHLKRLCNENKPFFVFWTIFCLLQYHVLGLVIRNFLSRPWIASFSASKNKEKSWRWFWKIWNFRFPTIIQKEFLAIAFMVGVLGNDYAYSLNVCMMWFLQDDKGTLKWMLAWAAAIKLYGWYSGL